MSMTRFLPFGRQGSMSAILRHDIYRQSPGILLHTETEALLDPSLQACIAQLRKLGPAAHVDMARHTGPDGESAPFRLNARTAAEWAPGSDGSEERCVGIAGVSCSSARQQPNNSK